MVALIVILSVMSYAFIGGMSGARHHSIASKKCHPHNTAWCTEGSWCGHVCVSLWVMGLLWPLAFPAFAGMVTGRSSALRETRTDKRRERELAEANHKVELARIRAEETQHLEKALEN